MCLIIFALRARADLPLVVAANRDEEYARPTTPAAPWPDAPHVIAGRDLRAGGTWLGMTRDGRWAAVTNFREPAPRPAGAPSRGKLVADYLTGDSTPEAYLRELATRADQFDGFNLLVGEGGSARWFSNRAANHPLHDRDLPPGVYGLSNHLLNTPWPKVEKGRADLEHALETGAQPDVVLEGLLDRTLADEADLPQTGVPLDLERVLSARFITGTRYGTRSSTVLRIAADGEALLMERSFLPPDSVTLVSHEFVLER